MLFGTDWPVIDPERAVAEIDGLELRPQTMEKLMRGNALRVFRLPATYRSMTMASGIRTSRARAPGKAAIICGERRVTYAQRVDRIDRVAFLAAGLATARRWSGSW